MLTAIYKFRKKDEPINLLEWRVVAHPEKDTYQSLVEHFENHVKNAELEEIILISE